MCMKSQKFLDQSLMSRQHQYRIEFKTVHINMGVKVMQASYVEVRIVLRDLNYPLTKQNLIQQALKHGASRCVIEDLKSIPDQEYISSISVFKEFEGIKHKWNK